MRLAAFILDEDLPEGGRRSTYFTPRDGSHLMTEVMTTSSENAGAPLWVEGLLAKLEEKK